MSDLGSETVSFSTSLVRIDAEKFDGRHAILYAALVVTPLAVGFLLGLAEASVLVTIGALNLLLVQAPYPGRTSGRVLAVATATNALAFAAGTVVGIAPRWLELPFVPVGLFVALWGTRYPRWENTSFLAAVMFAFAVGVPPSTALGIGLRPAAVLLGGVWAVAALATVSATSTRRLAEFFADPATPLVDPASSPGAVTAHSLVVAGVATLGLFIGLTLGLPRDYWIVLTVLVALRLDLSSTLAYSTSRILGTVAGAAVAFVITTATSDPWVLLPVLAGTTGIAFATRSMNYGIFSVGITLLVIVLLNLVYSGGPAFAVDRVIDTVIGGALSLVAALVLSEVALHRRRGSSPSA